MTFKFSAKTQNTFNVSSVKVATGGSFLVSKPSQRMVEFAANKAGRMNMHIDNIANTSTLEEDLVTGIGAFDDSVRDAADSADMLGPLGRAICGLTGIGVGALTENPMLARIANATCRFTGELWNQSVQEQPTEGDEELEEGSSGSEAPENTENDGGAEGGGEEGGEKEGDGEEDSGEGGSDAKGEEGESDDSDDESGDESDESGNAEDNEKFVGPPAPKEGESMDTKEGEAPADKSNPNPMDNNYVDPAIEKKYGERFRTYLGSEQKDLIQKLREINPVTDPAEESAEQGDYSGPSLGMIGGSNGGTSTGAWEVNGGDYVGPSSLGSLMNIDLTSTGNDWF